MYFNNMYVLLYIKGISNNRNTQKYKTVPLPQLTNYLPNINWSFKRSEMVSYGNAARVYFCIFFLLRMFITLLYILPYFIFQSS